MSSSTRLAPVGRLWLPGRRTTVRLVLVAMLLLTAAGVLYAGGDPGPVPPPASMSPGRAGPDGPDAPDGPDGPDGPDPPVPIDPGAGDGQRLPIPAGLRGVPVSLGEPAALAVLYAGDRVDLLALPDAGGQPVPVAAEATVLAVDRGSAAILLALTPDQADLVLSAPATTRFAVIVRA